MTQAEGIASIKQVLNQVKADARSKQRRNDSDWQDKASWHSHLTRKRCKTVGTAVAAALVALQTLSASPF